MKIFHSKLRIFKRVAIFAIFAMAVSSLNAEMIKSQKDTSLCFKNSYKAKSESKNSKRLALEGAYLACLEEFITYAMKENMKLPDSLSHLELELKQNLYLAAKSIEVFGLKKLTYGFTDEVNALCILEVPMYNLKKFEVMDFSANPEKINSFILKNPLLRLEVAFSLGMEIESFIDGDDYFAERNVFFKNEIELPLVPYFLLGNRVTFNGEYLKKLSDRELLNIYITALGQANLLESLNVEIENRGYQMSAKYLSSLKIARGDSLYGIDALQDKSEVELSILEKFLLDNGARLKFNFVAINNEKCKEASSLYFSENPDVPKIKALLLESFGESISLDALNLYGKILEYESNYLGAALFFAQTLFLDEEHSYAKANLAVAYKSLNLDDYAEGLAEKILLCDKSNDYSIKKAKEILKSKEDFKE